MFWRVACTKCVRVKARSKGVRTVEASSAAEVVGEDCGVERLAMKGGRICAGDWVRNYLVGDLVEEVEG